MSMLDWAISGVSALWVAEQDQHQRIELKPAVTRRLRVIDAREHRGAGLPQAGVK